MAQDEVMEEMTKKGKKKKGKDTDDYTEKRSGGLATVFVTLAIIVIWLVVFIALIKYDLGGFGSKVLYPVLKDVPVVKYILPEVEEEDEGSEYPYATMGEATAEIERLENELEKAKQAEASESEVVKELTAEVERLQVFENNQVEFEREKSEFYEQVIFADNAPDVSEYQKYYESIEPEYAADLYKQVVEQVQYEENVKEYAKAYAEMKPAKAAGIFEAMTDDLQLAAQILENMSAESRGAILGAMDPTVAARITKIMEP